MTPEVYVDMPVNQYIVNKNHSTGLFVSELIDGYPTYRVRLSHVDDIFEGKKQHWDESYPNARLLFGDGIDSKASRVLVRTHHAALYNGITNTVETGHITDGDSLKTLLHNGVHKSGAIIIFTFVIVDDILYFAPTGDEFLKDMVSKHAVHSNCAEEVTYSGDFFFVDIEKLIGHETNSENVNESERLTLVISNSSGTYKPDKELLPKVRELFQMNFPGLNIEVFDHSDPLFQKYKTAIREFNLLKNS
eukprot:CAMPEP_0206194026 /NCGR_PEP_ID=MMETSP0166-20121206/6938_1 /ASSEMBLY_ACC=CAM_ASM_000260 /TAXON_ID=95228 /ORGANISM="Vannella robusta, Strain DIVA3 518/3/11/1/6" /LENGTH=247 /DNA_ID=CAMNT_0053610893 /DNA_START=719 /DNA_END=1462 /DNA_ORIENTATION=-